MAEDKSATPIPLQPDLHLEVVRACWAYSASGVPTGAISPSAPEVPPRVRLGGEKPYYGSQYYENVTPIRLTELLSQMLAALEALGCRIEQRPAKPAEGASLSIVRAPKEPPAPPAPTSEQSSVES